MHLINLSPFDINGKGNFPSGLLPLTELSLGILPLTELFLKFSPKMNCHLYGASSCKSKTYKNNIQNSLWGRNYAKFLAKILKGFPWKRFCKDVCNMFFGANILNSNVLLDNLFP
jgi:hypothetical protein